MNLYAKGAKFERKVAELFRSTGCFVCRAAGSHGFSDLVAIRIGAEKIYFVQVKTNKRISPADWNELVVKSQVYGGIPILASKDERGGVKLEWLTGLNMPYSREKPIVAIDLPYEDCRGELGTDSGREAALPCIHQEGDGAPVG